MRLLNTRSLELSKTFAPSETPDYVILSHRWTSEEVTFADISKAPMDVPQSETRTRCGFSKIQKACEVAVQNGYTWIWIDSCCIDKSSSAELQEAINSMWGYYAEANVCYVYLADVPDSEAGWGEMFAKSDWFSRGWTLQELIAPVSVEFYAQNWEPVGTKLERYESIAEITSIDWNVLVRNQAVDLFSVAERLSWSAHREVTKGEDAAYSLLGLFDVNMPLLYGEGREKAFIRLQEAVYNATADHSMFLFRRSPYQGSQPLLASSPTCFCPKSDCTSCLSTGTSCLPTTFRYTDVIASGRWSTQAHEQIMVTFTPLRNEMSTVLPLLPFQDVVEKLKYLNDDKSSLRATHVAVLNHTTGECPRGALCLLLRQGYEGNAYIRLQAFPAILPDLRGLVPSFQPTKLLICPGREYPQDCDQVDISFSVQSDSFNVEAWDAPRNTSCIVSSTAMGQQEWFQIRIGRPRNPGALPQSHEVLCRLSSFPEVGLLLYVRLCRLHNVWSIKEVYQPNQGTRQRKRRTLFSSAVLADRCSIHLQDGRQLYVKLRRLPGSARTPQEATSDIRYQISLECGNTAMSTRFGASAGA